MGFPEEGVWEAFDRSSCRQGEVGGSVSEKFDIPNRLFTRLADMFTRVESAQAWLENVTHQMCNMVREYPNPNA